MTFPTKVNSPVVFLAIKEHGFPPNTSGSDPQLNTTVQMRIITKNSESLLKPCGWASDAASALLITTPHAQHPER